MTDIRVHEPNWLSLRGRALFFMPRLLALSSKESVRAGDIVSTSKQLERPYWLGPPSVRLIFSCQPTTFTKAEAARQAFNLLMEKSNKKQILENADIVASVLNMSGMTEVMNYLSMTDKDISNKTRLSLSLINNIKRGGRIFLSAGVVIVDALSFELNNIGKSRTQPMMLIDSNNSGLSSAVDNYRSKNYHAIFSSNKSGTKIIHKKDPRSEETSIDYADFSIKMPRPDLYKDEW